MKIIEYNQKNYPYLEVYDSGAMFIGSYVLKLFLQVALVVFLAMTEVSDTFTTTLGGICLITAINELAFILTPLAYGKIKGRNLVKDMGFEKKFSPWIGLLCVPLAFAVICLGSPLATAFVKLVELIGYRTDSVSSPVVDSAGDLALTLFFVALLPAFAEEYLFRGNIARGLSKKGYVFAIFMSAFIFAIMHGNPLQLVHQFIIGVVCAVLYFATGSLFPAIILHFCNNAIALIIDYINRTTGAGIFEFTQVWQYAVMCIAGLIASVALVALIVFIAKRYRDKKTSGKAQCKDAQTLFAYLCKSEAEADYDKKQQDELQQKIDEAMQQNNEAMVQVIQADHKATLKKENMKNRRALIYSVLIALAVWIISFIINVV